ncbi:hypothetical protein C8R45DRAFT_1109662 [Mycena sanguinolenta]|nr:hypothetical protein C8R45DRAFT_1109662 [Mycena sanguinolenta]
MTCQFRSGRKRALFGCTFIDQGTSPSHWWASWLAMASQKQDGVVNKKSASIARAGKRINTKLFASPHTLERNLRHCVAANYITFAESESDSVAVGTSPSAARFGCSVRPASGSAPMLLASPDVPVPQHSGSRTYPSPLVIIVNEALSSCPGSLF